MDRLFLAGLVHELDRSIAGARVRSIHLAAEARALVLGLKLSSSAEARELVFHLGPGVAGLFLRAPELDPKTASPRAAKLKKLFASSTVLSLEVAARDRVARLTVEQTRLSGRRRRFGVVVELLATRCSLYVVELDTGSVIECLSAGAARLGVGDRFKELDPPPHSSSRATGRDELEERLAVGAVEPFKNGSLDRNTLLAATGWTPLLVREMQSLMEAEGMTVGAAFDRMDAALREECPVLYLREEKLVLAPMALPSLERESAVRALRFGSFGDTVAEAVRRGGESERARALRQQLQSAVSKRLKHLGGLLSKLETERRRVPEPSELRKRGETLLAGLATAERVGEGRVRVTDAFDPEGGAIEMDIDPKLGLSDNAERMFRRSRKAERTEVELSKRIVDTTHQIEYAEGLQLSVEQAMLLDALDALLQEAEAQGVVAPDERRPRAKGRSERLPPRSFPTERGGLVLVGRSARSNDELTFRMAKPNDLWFHASGMPGSHVVLKRTAKVDDADVLAAAGLAAHFSKGRGDDYVEVMVTERRHVSKIKGAPPGLVRVESFKTIRVRPTPPGDDDREAAKPR